MPFIHIRGIVIPEVIIQAKFRPQDAVHQSKAVVCMLTNQGSVNIQHQTRTVLCAPLIFIADVLDPAKVDLTTKITAEATKDRSDQRTKCRWYRLPCP